MVSFLAPIAVKKCVLVSLDEAVDWSNDCGSAGACPYGFDVEANALIVKLRLLRVKSTTIRFSPGAPQKLRASTVSRVQKSVVSGWFVIKLPIGASMRIMGGIPLLSTCSLDKLIW